MTEEDLVCNEVVEGLKGKKHVDLACYETLDPKTVPCRFIKISSRRNGEEKVRLGDVAHARAVP